MKSCLGLYLITIPVSCHIQIEIQSKYLFVGRRKEGPLRRAHVEWEFVIFVRLMNQLWDPGNWNLKLGLSVSPLCVTAASSFCMEEPVL